ncbi:MAG: hypothetical protein D6725_03560, partial [Planctomycetota bacterium]
MRTPELTTRAGTLRRGPGRGRAGRGLGPFHATASIGLLRNHGQKRGRSDGRSVGRGRDAAPRGDAVSFRRVAFASREVADPRPVPLRDGVFDAFVAELLARGAADRAEACGLAVAAPPAVGFWDLRAGAWPVDRAACRPRRASENVFRSVQKVPCP